MKVIIVDDEVHSRNVLIRNLERLSSVEIVGSTDSPTNLTQLLQSHEVDLVFLDINLDGANGLDLADYLKQYYPHIMVIFVTGHAEYAIDGYNAYPVDFLTKPIDPIRLDKAILEAKSHMQSKSAPNHAKIGIRSGGSLKLINVEDIKFIEKSGRKGLIHLTENQEIECSDSLQMLETVLEQHFFYRPHQSYLIPLKKIEEISPDSYMRSYDIKLKDTNSKIPLSKNKYSELKNLLSQIGIILR